MLTFVSIVLALCIAQVSAIGCSETQKQQMLDAISKNPSWEACRSATSPFDFYLALTQEGPSPTTSDLGKFQGNNSCMRVYSDFQDAIKRANCDEVRDLYGLSVDKLMPPTTQAPSTTLIPITTIVLPANTPLVKPEPDMEISLAPTTSTIALVVLTMTLAMIY